MSEVEAAGRACLLGRGKGLNKLLQLDYSPLARPATLHLVAYLEQSSGVFGEGAFEGP